MKKPKKDKFSVMLCPGMLTNSLGEPDFSNPIIKYPLYASEKIDGVRIFCRNGELLTRKMLIHPNKNLSEYLSELCHISKTFAVCFDMELIVNNEEHGKNTSISNSYDKEIPNSTKVIIFDCFPLNNWEHDSDIINIPFVERLETLKIYHNNFLNYPKYKLAEQHYLNTPEEVKTLFDEIVNKGGEGLITTNRDSPYLKKRCSATSDYRLKWKKEETLDGKIIEIIPKFKMKKGITRTKNLWGHLETPTKNKENYKPINEIGCFVIETSDGKKSKISFGKGWNEELKKKLWIHKDNLENFKEIIGRELGNITGPLIGQMVEFVHVPCGAKKDGKFRHGRLLRFRPDK